jgi:hypothetical protein
MGSGKLKSFTLSELLIVMIITAIVVGMAFSVLRLVQKQMHSLQLSFEKTTLITLFEQRIWQDFNEPNEIFYSESDQKLLLLSEIDTIRYTFQKDYTIRNQDTIKVPIAIKEAYLNGKTIVNGTIDAVKLSASVLPEYTIFVSRKNDITLSMNQQDGL